MESGYVVSPRQPRVETGDEGHSLLDCYVMGCKEVPVPEQVEEDEVAVEGR